MTPEACPGCGTKLEPQMLACPNCPMSFPEDEPSSGTHPLKQTKAYAFLLPALVFASIGAAVWYMAMGLFRLGEENAISEPSPVLFGKAPAPAQTSSSTATADSAEPLPAGSDVQVDVEAPGAEPATSAVSIAPAEGPRRKAVKEWRLRGKVYDLLTLQPISGCALVFSDEAAGKRIETRSGASGAYRLVAPVLPDRGYAVTITKSGYAPAYLNPGMEGVAQMEEAKRRELAKELSSLLTATPYFVQAYDAEPLVTDFFLAPRR